MWLAVLGAALVAAPLPPSEIDRAIVMGRLDQARMMIAAAVAAGASGATIERPLAALAFAAGRNEEALARTTALLQANPDDLPLLEQATLAAVRCDALATARAFATRATAQPAASWRAWNAMGVIADAGHEWDAADRAYARAAALAPERFEIVNNRGWSLLLRGNWQEAAEVLAQAVALSPDSKRIANNLELAQMGMAGELPRRHGDESSAAYAARLNDAGVAARLRGDPARARAAFAQAIEASGTWYARADANLAAIEQRP